MKFRALLPVAALCAIAAAQVPSQQRVAALPPRAEGAYDAVSTRFDRAAAFEVVELMQRYWRIAGNPGFNASIDHLRDRLERARLPVIRVEHYAGGSPGWDYTVGSVWIAGEETPVLSKDADRVSLAINSFSTPDAGLTARLVDVGPGTATDFTDRDVRGAVVLGDASLGALWREAVRNRGAAGVVSTQVSSYIRPVDPQRMDEAHKDVLQWGSVPYDEKARAFGFKSSFRAARRLREAVKRNPDTKVRVEVASRFYRGPTRTLIAEIPGRTRPTERIVMVAHVQEPGANDNASGCATLFGLARALQESIDSGQLPPPERTLTFMWVDEIRGSRQWLTAHPEEAKDIQYMFSMDMTGEDTAKTGGTFLIEKQADPSAVWARPSDPHSDWGASQVKAETLKGSLLNDLHIAVANRRARDTGWIVRTNPYEGGSDHTVFANAGVPSLLNWHFTDRFYHTNQDTIDKVSSAEMENVGITVATSAYLLATADERDALAVVELLARAASARLELERRQGKEIIGKAEDRADAEAVEAQVIAAWIKWYGEALDSVARLPTFLAAPSLAARIEAAKQTLR